MCVCKCCYFGCCCSCYTKRERGLFLCLIWAIFHLHKIKVKCINANRWNSTSVSVILFFCSCCYYDCCFLFLFHLLACLLNSSPTAITKTKTEKRTTTIKSFKLCIHTLLFKYYNFFSIFISSCLSFSVLAETI